MAFSFSSVEDFLRKTREAKTKQRPEVEERISEYLDDPHMVGVSPEMADAIDTLLEKYGDEALRQVGLFCLGKWFAVHTGVVEDLVKMERIPAAMSSIMDATRISDAIALLESVGSFGGDDEWKKMLQETLVNAVNDAMNQRNKD